MADKLALKDSMLLLLIAATIFDIKVVLSFINAQVSPSWYPVKLDTLKTKVLSLLNTVHCG